MERRIKVTDGIKGENILDYPGGPNVIRVFLQVEEGGRRGSEKLLLWKRVLRDARVLALKMGAMNQGM